MILKFHKFFESNFLQENYDKTNNKEEINKIFNNGLGKLPEKTIDLILFNLMLKGNLEIPKKQEPKPFHPYIPNRTPDLPATNYANKFK